MPGPEHQFQAAIVSVLENLCGFDVYVTSQPRAFLGTPGMADLYALHPEKRLRLWIEVKSPESGYGLTDHQELFAERVVEAGGTFHLIDSEEKLESVLRSHGWEIEMGEVA